MDSDVPTLSTGCLSPDRSTEAPANTGDSKIHDLEGQQATTDSGRDHPHSDCGAFRDGPVLATVVVVWQHGIPRRPAPPGAAPGPLVSGGVHARLRDCRRI